MVESKPQIGAIMQLNSSYININLEMKIISNNLTH